MLNFKWCFNPDANSSLSTAQLGPLSQSPLNVVFLWVFVCHSHHMAWNKPHLTITSDDKWILKWLKTCMLPIDLTASKVTSGLLSAKNAPFSSFHFFTTNLQGVCLPDNKLVLTLTFFRLSLPWHCHMFSSSKIDQGISHCICKHRHNCLCQTGRRKTICCVLMIKPFITDLSKQSEVRYITFMLHIKRDRQTK